MGNTQGFIDCSEDSGFHPGWQTNVVFLVKKLSHLWFKNNCSALVLATGYTGQGRIKNQMAVAQRSWTGEVLRGCQILGTVWRWGKQDWVSHVWLREDARSLEGFCLRDEKGGEVTGWGEKGCRWKGLWGGKTRDYDVGL